MIGSDDYHRELGGRRYMRRQKRLREIRQAIEANGYAAAELESLGIQALEAGDYDAAEVYVREACLSRKDPTAMARFAQLMERALEPERALKAYEFAVGQGLDKPDIVLALALLYERQRRYEDANRAAASGLERSSEASPEHESFSELKRRVETKLGLRRQLDRHRGGATTSPPAREPAAAGPEPLLKAWLEALRAGDRGRYLGCHADAARAAADFEALREWAQDVAVLRVTGASEEARHLRVRCRCEKAGHKTAFSALLSRLGTHWRIESIDLPAAPPAEA